MDAKSKRLPSTGYSGFRGPGQQPNPTRESAELHDIAGDTGNLDVPLSTRSSAANQTTEIARLTSILAQLDVALSTRAVESGGNLATTVTLLTSILAALDVALSTRASAVNQATEIAALASILGQLDVGLSTRATEATLALIKAKTDNLDAALSTRLKAADTLAGVTALGSITSALPAGTNTIGAVDSKGLFAVRNWSQLYNLRGQRYIATTGYITADTNTVQNLAAFENPSSDTVILLDRAEFGSSTLAYFSRYGGAATLATRGTAQSNGRTDGGSGAAAVGRVYVGGAAAGGGWGGPQFTVGTAGTLRKVAPMDSTKYHYMLTSPDLGGLSILQPGQVAYWKTDETPGGAAGTYKAWIDFEWVEMSLTDYNALVAAVQAHSQY